MVSQKKKNKQKNAFLYKTALKNKRERLKRMLFFTSSDRKLLKQELKNETEL